MIVSGDKFGPYPPGVDPGALKFEALDDVFIKVVAADDHRLGKSRFVQNLPRLDAEKSQIAGVEADAGKFVAALPQFAADLSCAPDAFQRIVGVNEKNAVVGQGPGVSVEGFQLRIERHDPTMRVCTKHRNAEG